ncbi:hypothetical protein [Photobacterium leiognathi]|uniref:hypothetical protein n=1 Tax=Photobacterium leiognathi TaxID=553611 RepID=UPI00298253AE|nr:hypothetical protein [Photobacterium leiognathi]
MEINRKNYFQLSVGTFSSAPSNVYNYLLSVIEHNKEKITSNEKFFFSYNGTKFMFDYYSRSYFNNQERRSYYFIDIDHQFLYRISDHWSYIYADKQLQWHYEAVSCKYIKECLWTFDSKDKNTEQDQEMLCGTISFNELTLQTQHYFQRINDDLVKQNQEQQTLAKREKEESHILFKMPAFELLQKNIRIMNKCLKSQNSYDNHNKYLFCYLDNDNILNSHQKLIHMTSIPHKPLGYLPIHGTEHIIVDYLDTYEKNGIGINKHIPTTRTKKRKIAMSARDYMKHFHDYSDLEINRILEKMIINETKHT